MDITLKPHPLADSPLRRSFGITGTNSTSCQPLFVDSISSQIQIDKQFQQNCRDYEADPKEYEKQGLFFNFKGLRNGYASSSSSDQIFIPTGFNSGANLQNSKNIRVNSNQSVDLFFNQHPFAKCPSNNSIKRSHLQNQDLLGKRKTQKQTHLNLSQQPAQKIEPFPINEAKNFRDNPSISSVSTTAATSTSTSSGSASFDSQSLDLQGVGESDNDGSDHNKPLISPKKKIRTEKKGENPHDSVFTTTTTTTLGFNISMSRLNCFNSENCFSNLDNLETQNYPSLSEATFSMERTGSLRSCQEQTHDMATEEMPYLWNHQEKRVNKEMTSDWNSEKKREKEFEDRKGISISERKLEKEHYKAGQHASSSSSSQQQQDSSDGHKECQDQSELIRECIALVERTHGKLVSKSICRADSIVTISCFLQHTWETNLRNLRSGEWCSQCQAHQYKQAEIYANAKEGTLLNDIFQPELKFECSRGHQWSSSYRSYDKKWCTICRRLLKEEFQQYIKEQEARHNQEYSEKQEELYRQARRNSMFQSESKTMDDETKNQDYTDRVVKAAKNVDAEVEKLAIEQADKLFSNPVCQSGGCCQKSDFSHEQAVAVFQMIMFPEQVLQIFFSVLSAENLQQHYRSLAQNIHPDQNYHPQAAQSFQKLNQFYNDALQLKN